MLVCHLIPIVFVLCFTGLCCQLWRVLFYCGSGGHRETTGEKFACYIKVLFCPLNNFLRTIVWSLGIQAGQCNFSVVCSKTPLIGHWFLLICAACRSVNNHPKTVSSGFTYCVLLSMQMPKFFDLCSDSLWGIRKACAECFMMVSNSTSPEVRRAKLSPLFISLISDQSRWVRLEQEQLSHLWLHKINFLCAMMRISHLLVLETTKHFGTMLIIFIETRTLYFSSSSVLVQIVSYCLLNCKM